MITGRPPRDALERAAAKAATNPDPMEPCLNAGATRYSELLLEAVDGGLGMTVVAVGVETQTGWDLLSRLGVDAVQGYLVAHPLPDEAIPHWVGIWNAGGE